MNQKFYCLCNFDPIYLLLVYIEVMNGKVLSKVDVCCDVFLLRFCDVHYCILNVWSAAMLREYYFTVDNTERNMLEYCDGLL